MRCQARRTWTEGCMMTTLKKCLDLLTPKERRTFWLLMAALSFMAFANMLGIAAVLPFLSVLGDPDIINRDGQIGMIYDFFGFSSYDKFIIFLGFFVAFAFIATVGVRIITIYMTSTFAQFHAFTISRRIMIGYFLKPYDWFTTKNSSDMIKTILQEMGDLINQFVVPMLNLVAHFLLCIFLIALIIFVDWKSAVVTALILSSAFFGVYVFVKQIMSQTGERRMHFNKERFRAVSENLASMKEIKVSGIESSAVRRYDHAGENFAHETAKANVLSQVPQQILEGIAFVVMIGVLLTLFMMHGKDIGAFIPIAGVYAAVGVRIIPSLKTIFSGAGKMRTMRPLLDRIHSEYMEIASESVPKHAGEALHLRDRIELRDVYYKYPTAEEPTLRGLSFEIPAHSSIGLVGGTGAGKTSAIDVILGLLEPSSGAVLVDGAPVATETARRAWQRSIGYVPQHIFLSANTVAANIALGVPAEEIDMAAVERAARVAQLHDFIMKELPDGYQSEIGDRGVNLSGGQRQRIGIARALYRDPEVLVLDEATSALDVLTERAVMRALATLGDAKTIIMVAHRLSTVRDCDEILLLERGQVAARGRFDELVTRSDVFREMAAGVA
jgi:ABC-type multidrug transport system fused ATPase/permease subunit